MELSVIESIRLATQVEQMDWENDPCSKCGVRRSRLYSGRCAECADDLLQEQTGCRFGYLNGCTHYDCQGLTSS